MIINIPILLLATHLILLLPLISSHAPSKCVQSCGSNHFPYPFGFSSACKIHLNCTNHQPHIGEFPIQSITSDAIKITIEAKCHRPFGKIRQLFTRNYAPTDRNALLFQNCTGPISTCQLQVRDTPVQTNFETANCSGGNVTCYQEKVVGLFLHFENMSRSRCGNLLSAISAVEMNSTEGVLEVQTVELGWWLQGSYPCDAHANYTKIVSPSNHRPAYRCWCPDGFVGDGYWAGTGCRKASSGCNPRKYISGECGGKTRIFVLIGGVVGGAFLTLSLGLICCFISKQIKLKARNITKRRLYEAAGTSTIPIYPFKDVEKATSYFSEKQRLGTGAHGTVYAGKLQGEEWVAIKRIKNRDNESIEQVMNEIKLLSSVNHPNLVRLLGCSIENGQQIIVYEFMPNGTLYQHLQRERGNGLAWPIRINIATETACAIAHLHSAIKPPIFHRDIKSSNILLDHNFMSKVADFGLSRLGITEVSHISTAPQGTPGYLDPQYHQDFQLSDKSDVYSFGVVLVEIITGLKVVDFSRPKNKVNLAALAADRIGNGRLDEILDPFLDPDKDDSWTIFSVQKVAELAFRCLAFHRDMRPSMMEVAAELEEIRLSRWAHSGVKSFMGLSSFSTNSCHSSSEKLLSGRMIIQTEDEIESEFEMCEEKTVVDYLDERAEIQDNSSVSVQDLCLSELSSPSSSSLLNNVII